MSVQSSANGVVGFAAFTLAVIVACGGNSHAPTRGASGQGGQIESSRSDAGVGSADVGSSGASSSGGASTDPPDEYWSPNLPIDGDSALVVLGSTLGRDRKGQIRWLFTFRNDSQWPLCGYAFNAMIHDSEGAMLAGARINTEEYRQGMPVFSGLMFGSIHELYREDGALFLRSCVAPGGRGLGWAEVWNATNFSLTEQEVAAILQLAARLRHDLKAPTSAIYPKIEPAPDLPRLQGLGFVDTPDGKVVRGTAVSRAELLDWKGYTLLFDSSGAIVDLVKTSDKIVLPTPKDSPVDFSSPPVLAESRRFEIFLESSSLKRD